MASFQEAPGKRRHGNKRHPSAAEDFEWEPRRAESRHSLPYRIRQPDMQKSDRRRSKQSLHGSRTHEDLDVHSMPPVPLLTRSATTHSQGRLRYVDEDDDDNDNDDDDEDETDDDDEIERERLRGRMHSRSRAASRSKSRGTSRPQSKVVSRVDPPVKPSAQSGGKSKSQPKVKARSHSKVRRPSSRSSHSTESITIQTPTRSPPSAHSFRGSSDDSSDDSADSTDYAKDRRRRTRTLKERMNPPDSEPAANPKSRSRPPSPEKFVPEIESPSEDSEDQAISRPQIIVRRVSSRRKLREQSRSPSRGPRRHKHGDPRASSSPKRSQKYYHSDFTVSEKRSFSRSRATSASRRTSPYSVESSPKPTKPSSAYVGDVYSTPAHAQAYEKDLKIHVCVECGETAPKLAKLKCGHRWCESCLKMRFKSSIKDARNMPPKCCTADIIPLKHVNDMFNDEFKRTWNKKYREFTIKNCHYCPRAKCQERIRPEDICHHTNGRTSATCRKCETELCGLCFNKWHESKHCPVDANTAHWKRCFNCQAMVELKEGSSRMACRCGARYCLICETKLRSCKCPSFVADEDEPELVQIPVAVVSRERLGGFEGSRGPRSGWQSHREYREDEQPGRRQHVGPEVDDEHDDFIDDMNHEFAIGTAAGHLMNDEYRRAQGIAVPPVPPPAVPLPPPSVVPDRLTTGAGYVSGVGKVRGARSSSMERRLADRFSEQRQPPSIHHRPFSQHFSSIPAPPMSMAPKPAQPASVPNPLSRRHTMDNEMYEMQFDPRYAAAPGPRRTAPREYMDDFDIHTSLGRRRVRHMAPPPPSALAGLTGAGNGMNRVNEWMDHVDPYPPEHQTVA